MDDQAAVEAELDRRPLTTRSAGWALALASAVARSGLTPNAISVIGMVAGVLAGVAFHGTSREPEWERVLFGVGAVLVQVRLLCNMLDGMVAIETGRTSPVGELYNEIPDRVSDAATLIGLGYALGSDPALGYGAAVVAVFVAYVRAMAKAAGTANDFCGPLAKPQRMAIVTVLGLFLALAPDSVRGVTSFPVLVLWVLIVGGAFTALRRIVRASRALRGDAR